MDLTSLQSLQVPARLPLARLSRLTVSSQMTEVMALFQCIAIPASTRVHIRGTHSVSTTLKFSAFLTSLHSSYSTPISAVEFRTLSFGHSSLGLDYAHDIIHLALYVEPVEEDDICRSTSHWEVSIHVPREARFAYDDGVITDLCNSEFRACLGHITHLQLWEPRATSKVLTSSLGMLPMVSYAAVHVTYGADTRDSFVHALWGERERQAADSGVSLSLPFARLEDIYLEGFHFKPADVEMDMEYDADLGLLRDCFAQRAKHGAKVKTLQIDIGFNVADEDIELLREVVKDVKWDGTEAFDYDFDGDNSEDYEGSYSDGYFSGEEGWSRPRHDDSELHLYEFNH